jgi:hypothetical protein
MAAVMVKVTEGEEEVLEGASGSPSSLDAKQKRQEEKGFWRSLDIQREIPTDSLLSLWSVCQEKVTEEGKRKKSMARVLLAKFKFKFEFV